MKPRLSRWGLWCWHLRQWWRTVALHLGVVGWGEAEVMPQQVVQQHYRTRPRVLVWRCANGEIGWRVEAATPAEALEELCRL